MRKLLDLDEPFFSSMRTFRFLAQCTHRAQPRPLVQSRTAAAVRLASSTIAPRESHARQGQDAALRRSRALARGGFVGLDVGAEGEGLRSAAPHLRSLVRQLARTRLDRGDHMPRGVVAQLCDNYVQLDPRAKDRFLCTLAAQLGIDQVETGDTIALVQRNMQQHHSISDAGDTTGVDVNNTAGVQAGAGVAAHSALQRLRQCLKPVYQSLFEQVVAQQADGLQFLVRMRADVLSALRRKRKAPAPKSADDDLISEILQLQQLEDCLRAMLIPWFSVGFLHLSPISYEKSSALLLEQVARAEAVRPFSSLHELRTRMSTGRGRRCYGLFHPSVREEPLAFVHVALLPNIAESMQYITEESAAGDETQARAAVFYSISSAQPGLSGIDLGNALIKSAAAELKTTFPSVTRFATLSPIPLFRSWLEIRLHAAADGAGAGAGAGAPVDADEAEALAFVRAFDMALDENDPQHIAAALRVVRTANELAPLPVHQQRQQQRQPALLRLLDAEAWYEDKCAVEALRWPLLRLGSHYLSRERRRGRAICPVANFHVRNGASIHRINWLADHTPRGLAQSCGMMVNYRYDLDECNANNEAYTLHGTIVTDEPFECIFDS